MCRICGQVGECHPKCPNYSPPKTRMYCESCGEGIYDGEEYIENDDGEYAHYDCFKRMRDLITWLGYEVKTKGD